MQALHEKLKNIVVVTGHFGSGKTNFSVNLARSAAAAGRAVTLVDLDIVNPYFRAADNTAELEALGVCCINPDFANTNVDIPSLPPTVLGALETASREPDRLTIIDVGGDNGAVALGMYGRFFKKGEYDLLYTASMYRPLTEETDDALMILREIEMYSRIPATGIVNNSNLGDSTSADDVRASLTWADELSQKAALPIVCTAARSSLSDELRDIPDIFFIEDATKHIF